MYDSPAGNAAAQSPVQTLSQQCAENLKGLHDTISQLEARLELVASPQPPQTANGKDTQPAAPVSSHVMFLGSTAMGIQDAAIRLNRLMSRLEL